MPSPCLPPQYLTLFLLATLFSIAHPLRTVTTLDGEYTLLDSQCSLYRRTPGGMKYALLLPPRPEPQPSGDVSPRRHLNVMLSMGGAGSSRQTWEDLAARLWERTLPCVPQAREHTSLHRADADAHATPPPPSSCMPPGDPHWIVVGAVAPRGVALHSPEGCALLSDLVAHVLQSDDLLPFTGGGQGVRDSATSPRPAVHISGVSSGGIASFACAVQRPDLFASVTAFPGYFDGTGQAAVRQARAALAAKPLRVYVGSADELFRETAQEQFGVVADTVEDLLLPEARAAGGGVVKVVPDATHDLLLNLQPDDVCRWLREIGQPPVGTEGEL